ncbi:MAG TPA: ribosome biogenesis GTP-binding protein YihA/YsxC [Paenalcaligenes sp.]|nr:ribosome biogenesis GTP-binding protein YihA/YsxC [Paenalcaligenes sp.]
MSILHRARFVTSAAHARQLPPAGPPEVCFVGRSNVGKSSAINVLTNQRRLAHASKTPGRTRLINFFGLPDPLHPDDYLGFLVDLPGYGYAAVDKAQKQQWDALIGTYLQQRSSIAGIVLLIDIRRGLTELDLQLAHWIAPTQKPVLILATKADKLAYGRRVTAMAAIQKQWAKYSPSTVLAFSATQRLGLTEASEQIENWVSPKVIP